MKILWFTNSPCNAIDVLTKDKVTGGGWLYALSEKVSKIEGLELHIAFYWGKSMNRFSHKGIVFHPLFRKGNNSKWGRMKYRISSILNETNDSSEICEAVDLVKTVNPDLIHIHGSEENFCQVASLLSEHKIVLSIQGMLSPYYEKLFSGLSRQEIGRNEGLYDKLTFNGIWYKSKSMKKRALREYEALKHIPHIIGRTDWDKYCSLVINPQRNYYEVGEILRDSFYNNRWQKVASSEKLQIVTTVSHGYYKGFETICKTANLLTQTGFPFEWNVIGLTKGNITMFEKVLRLNTDDINIKLLGRKNAEQMVDILVESDIYCQVSHIENSPNSLCEAMLLGMPIVATFAGGTSSMLADGCEGILVQDGEPYALGGAIMNLSQDFQRAKDFGEKAHLRAVYRHNPDYVSKQLVETYKNILGI